MNKPALLFSTTCVAVLSLTNSAKLAVNIKTTNKAQAVITKIAAHMPEIAIVALATTLVTGAVSYRTFRKNNPDADFSAWFRNTVLLEKHLRVRKKQKKIEHTVTSKISPAAFRMAQFYGDYRATRARQSQHWQCPTCRAEESFGISFDRAQLPRN